MPHLPLLGDRHFAGADVQKGGSFVGALFERKATFDLRAVIRHPRLLPGHHPRHRLVLRRRRRGTLRFLDTRFSGWLIFNDVSTERLVVDLANVRRIDGREQEVDTLATLEEHAWVPRDLANGARFLRLDLSCQPGAPVTSTPRPDSGHLPERAAQRERSDALSPLGNGERWCLRLTQNSRRRSPGMTTRRHQRARGDAESHPPAVGRAPIADALTRGLGAAGSRGAPPTSRTVLALQRTAGNAAVAQLVGRRPVVQRAVVAIDGPGEDATNLAGKATRACLENLTTAKTHKGGRVGLDPGGARGQVAGPAPVSDVKDRIRPGFLSPQETLYVLGHGSGQKVAGLDPPTMAATLRGWFNQDFFGKLKLVSCVSASTDPRLGVSKTYADALAQQFAASIPAAAGSAVARKLGGFLPSSVDGIVGVGWVDEHTGRLLSIPLDEYLALAPKQQEAFGIAGKGARSSAIRAALPRAPGAYAGKGGKRRYRVG